MAHDPDLDDVLGPFAGIKDGALMEAHARIMALEQAMRDAIRIVDVNLWHQREKVADASAILKEALGE